MKKQFFLLALCIIVSGMNMAQVGINSDNSVPDDAAMLDVKSSTKGFLPPRLSTMQRNAISAPPSGLMIFNTDCNEYQFFNGLNWRTLGNGSGQIASPGAINGNTNLCANVAGEAYVAAVVPDAASYSWTVPAGASIVSGQGTNAIMVNYGASGGSLCVTANTACYNSAPTCIAVNVSPSLVAGISISTSSLTVCEGTLATFTSTFVNGGTSPLFQWKMNNLDITGATNSSYSYVPLNNDVISCRMISNGTCVISPSVYSNYITMTVFSSVPDAPAEGIHVAATTEITWKWNSVINATGYKWSTTNDYATATDMGAATNKPETGMACNSAFTRYVWAYNSCGNSTPAILTGSTLPGPLISVAIAALANPVCSGSSVTFTATPVNGGTMPQYQWRKNGMDITGATNVSYTYSPANGDSLRCMMTSNATCAQNNPSWSNMVTMMVNPFPNPPTAGTHVAALTDVTWNWNSAVNALGYKWNTSNDYATATDMGTATTKTETGLTCGTPYIRYVWAYNNCGASTPVTTLTQTTLACPFYCGTTILNINHVTSGGVAPVNKSTTYSSATNIPGETTKCWITKNLGATQQASSVSDNTESSAGWYWQFNRKQGYKHDGITRTPGTTWISSINENSDWQTVNDPCGLELGPSWRLLTYTEWLNVFNTGGWTNWNGPWYSGLKLHASGFLNISSGALGNRGLDGHYWGSTQNGLSFGWTLYFSSGTSEMVTESKADGFSARCLRDN
jgi:hypothetical protein